MGKPLTQDGSLAMFSPVGGVDHIVILRKIQRWLLSRREREAALGQVRCPHRPHSSSGALRSWLLLVEPLEARVAPAVLTWTGAADNFWNNPSNWSPLQVPAAGDDLVFPGAAANKANINNLTPGTAFNQITFSGAGYSLGGNNIALGAGGITDSSAGTNTISFAINLAANRTFDVQVGSGLTITGSIGGLGGVVKDGSGLLVLNGANTYDGTTTIQLGQLEMQNSSALGSTVGGTTVLGGAVLRVSQPMVVGAEPLTLNGIGVGNGALHVDIPGGSTVNWSGQITLASNSKIGLTKSGAAGGDILFEVSGGVNQSGGLRDLTLDRPGGNSSGMAIFLMSAANSYTGTTFVMSSIGAPTVLRLSTNDVMPNGGRVFLDGNTVFDLNDKTDTIGSLEGLGNLNFGNAVPNTLTLGTDNSSSMFSGVITANSNGNDALIKAGSGVFTLSGNNAYAGKITVLGGLLQISDDSNLGAVPGAPAPGTITLDGGGLSVTAASVAIHPFRGIDLGPTGGVFDIQSSFSLTYNGIVGGPGTFSKFGSGTLTLGGSASNVFGGYALISDGVVELTKDPGVVALPGGLMLVGGTVRYLNPNQIGDNSIVIVNGGTLDFFGEYDTIGALEYRSGSILNYDPGSALVLTSEFAALIMQDVTIDFDISLAGASGGDIVFDPFNNGTARINGNLDLGNQSRNINVGDGGAASDMVISGIITSTSGGINKGGPGTLEFDGAVGNSFPGPVNVFDGELALNKSVLNQAIPNDLFINGGNVRLLSSEQINNASLVTVVSGTFSFSGFSETIGRLNYHGGNVINGAMLGLTSTGVALEMRNVALPFDVSLQGASGGDIVFDPINNGTALISGNILPGGIARQFIIGDGTAADDMLITGLISGGGSAITKMGPGTLRLDANNTYNGITTVNAGGLIVNGLQPSSPVVINGGVLGGTGTVGSITGGTGGSIAPGNPSTGPGILTNSNLSLTSFNSFNIQLNGTIAGTDYDRLIVAGTVTLSNAALNVSVGFTPLVGSTFLILDNDAADAITDTFAGLPEGSVFMAGGLPFRISYTGGTGNDVVLTRVAVISGRKFEDLNGNGTDNGGADPSLSGWTIELWQDGGDSTPDFGVGDDILIGSILTNGSGNYALKTAAPGLHFVREIIQAGWTATTLNPVLLTIAGTDTVMTVDFGNFQNITISGQKFNDLNGNGLLDGGEPGLAGWTIFLDLNGNGLLDGGEPNTLTSGSGNYSFPNLGPGVYLLREVQQAGWTQTTLNPAAINAVSGGNVNGVNFGNMQASSFVDSDGDVYTVTLSGPGSFLVFLYDPDQDGKGPISSILLSSTDATSVLNITIISAAGNGNIPVMQGITGGALDTLNAPNVTLVGNGSNLTGGIKTVELNNMAAGSVLQLGSSGGVTSTKFIIGQIAAGASLISATPFSLVSADAIFGGSITVTAGAANSITTLMTKAGPMNADLTLNGGIKSLLVYGGGAAGLWQGTNFGKIYVRNGNFTATAALNNISALRVQNGDFSGVLNIANNIGALDVRGGNMNNALVAAKAISRLLITGNLSNSNILTGWHLGNDHAIGGAGGNADSIVFGVINAVVIGGNATDAVIGAGLNFGGDGLPRGGDDSIVGGASSRLNNIKISGGANANSYFAAGAFGPVKIGGATIDPTSDPRFFGV